MKKILLTMDTDFVSEDILNYSLKIFEEYSVKLNLFVTGKYDCLKKYDFVEVYPHPNFDSKSSHGETIVDVESYFRSIDISKRGYRSHKYIQSNDINEYMKEKGYLFKSNTCTNMSNVQPFVSRCGLVEFPIFFEDGGYLKYNSFDLKDTRKLFNNDGVTTLLFHPFHIALNSKDFKTSRSFKDSLSYNEFNKLTINDLKDTRKKEGIETFLRDVLDKLSKENCVWFSDVLSIFLP